MTLPPAALWLTGVEVSGKPDNGEADETFVTAATVLSALFATLLVITVMPGSSILDLDIDVGIIVLAFYVTSIV
ncbi:hypothetical protein [Bradyrhizobium sp. MOS002]|uniref:hypothetical protein n=1 Tax=Bradyrhizobium sp. MOS002 TaxID=2133947 RepID=UPI000D117AD9|nr:hypothetical protein [Bradyrhizobium sp. MOS002]PSO32530.1 hypothetical protein C7G41_12855 [Bradyrhizobium sp. MOS002]